jgi:hypothetical protein
MGQTANLPGDSIAADYAFSTVVRSLPFLNEAVCRWS